MTNTLPKKGWRQDDIAIIPKSETEEFRIQLLCSPKGWIGAGIRVFYPGREDGEMRPGRQGVAFESKCLPKLIEALRVAVKRLEEAELSDRALSFTPSVAQQGNATQRATPTRRGKLTPADIQEAVNAHVYGASVTDIAKTLGVDKATISRALARQPRHPDFANVPRVIPSEALDGVAETVAQRPDATNATERRERSEID